VPFSFGQKNPVIVLSEALIDTFPREQLEIMLAHELAHLKRNDSRAGWIALALRDILFFNPFSHLTYHMIEEEKERACDRIALEATRRKPAEVAHTLVDVALFYQSFQMPKGVLYPVPTKGFLYRESFLTRRIKLINTPFVTKDPSKRRKTLKYLLFFLLLYVQIGFVWHNGNNLIMFR
jgi:beta-lactamase regulating signal transducer with metallopeptidase domain